MPRIKIKQLDTRIATAGVHFGGGPERRKLFPGEVVDIPEGDLFDAVWATGRIEITPEPANRPLDFETEREARFTSPLFKPRDPSETEEMERARAAVTARMAEVSEAPPVAESPIEDRRLEPVAEKPTRNRRAARRAAIEQAADNEQENTA